MENSSTDRSDKLNESKNNELFMHDSSAALSSVYTGGSSPATIWARDVEQLKQLLDKSSIKPQAVTWSSGSLQSNPTGTTFMPTTPKFSTANSVLAEFFKVYFSPALSGSVSGISLGEVRRMTIMGQPTPILAPEFIEIRLETLFAGLTPWFIRAFFTAVLRHPNVKVMVSSDNHASYEELLDEFRLPGTLSLFLRPSPTGLEAEIRITAESATRGGKESLYFTCPLGNGCDIKVDWSHLVNSALTDGVTKQARDAGELIRLRQRLGVKPDVSLGRYFSALEEALGEEKTAKVLEKLSKK